MKNIEFCKVRNDFQMELHEYLRKNTIACYKTQQQQNIKNPINKARQISSEGIKYAKEAIELEKVEVNGTANKANFLNNPATRL